MNFKEQLAADVSAVFFNPDEFAESVTYRSGYAGAVQSILAIPEIGEDNVQGNTFASDGSSARAFFWLRAADVPQPEPPDVIVHAGVEWNVARISESAEGMHKVECVGSESPL